MGTAALSGFAAVQASAVGALVGGLLLLPLALAGGFGGADVLLLAAVGAWHGWHFALVAACWAALAGGVLALVGWARGQRTLAYAPAIMTGALIAMFSG
jgi:leader peptidase (prepilin peptidase) / N-methyltransferase